MKNVRLVLLISVLAASAACSGPLLTASEENETLSPPVTHTADADSVTARDGGHSIGSGG